MRHLCCDSPVGEQAIASHNLHFLQRIWGDLLQNQRLELAQSSTKICIVFGDTETLRLANDLAPGQMSMLHFFYFGAH